MNWPRSRKQKDDLVDDFIEDLKQLKVLTEQVNKVVLSLQGEVVPLQFPKYNKICSDLFQALVHQFPLCRIHPFGSTITGLCFKNSDVDLYISGVRHHLKEIKCLYIIKGILSRSHEFTNLIVISHAKIPILKCVHAETGINCDINLRNLLGVRNSALIKYFIDINPKIKMLLINLKYWARKHHLTGQSHLFTNYSICLLVIFLLQQKPYSAPSVLELQQEHSCDHFQGHWNGGFTALNFFSTALANTTLLELFNHFFTFYSEFEYSRNMICPYLGHTVRKDEFKTPEDLPSYYNSYKDYVKVEENPPFKYTTIICIQDPFEHCRNTVSVVNESVLRTFIKFCNLGKDICKNGECSLIYKLFTESPPDIVKPSNSRSVFTQFYLEQDINLKYIDKQINDDDPNRRDTIKEIWFETVHKFLVTVLKDFLHFELMEIQSTSSKVMKNESQSDVYDKHEKYYYRCSAPLNLWQTRKQVLKEIDAAEIKNLGLIEKEKVITNRLRDKYKSIKITTYIIIIEICLELKCDPTKAVLSLKDVSSYKKTFKCFASFFYPNFKEWWSTYEKELNQSCE